MKNMFLGFAITLSSLNLSAQIYHPLVQPDFCNGTVRAFTPASYPNADPNFTIDIKLQNANNKANSTAMYNGDLFVGSTAGQVGIYKYPSYASNPSAARSAVSLIGMPVGFQGELVGIATDAAGNLFVSAGPAYGNTSILRFTRAANGSYTYSNNLGNAGVTAFWANIAFDGAGNLWVSDFNNNRVVVYLAATLTQNNPAYRVLTNYSVSAPNTITVANTTQGLNVGVASVLATPEGLAFDQNGNLWIANNNNNETNNSFTSIVKVSSAMCASVLALPANGSRTFNPNGNATGPNTLNGYSIYNIPNPPQVGGNVCFGQTGRLCKLGGLQIDKANQRMYVNEQIGNTGLTFALSAMPAIANNYDQFRIQNYVSSNPGNGGLTLAVGTSFYNNTPPPSNARVIGQYDPAFSGGFRTITSSVQGANFRSVSINRATGAIKFFGNTQDNNTNSYMLVGRTLANGSVARIVDGGFYAGRSRFPVPSAQAPNTEVYFVRNLTNNTDCDLLVSTASDGVNRARLVTAANVGASALWIYGMAVQPDGKVLLVGEATFGSVNKAIVCRLQNGGLNFDNTFGTNGVYASSLNNSQFRDIELRPNGKIVLGGHFGLSANGITGVVAQLNSNGTLDNSFGSNGTVSVNYQNSTGATLFSSEIYTMGLVSDGSIFVGGAAKLNSSANTKPAHAKISADGSTFTYLRTNFSFDGAVYALTVQSDGKAYIGGQGHGPNVQNTDDIFIYRLNANGIPDNTFNFGLQDPSNGSVDAIYDMTIANDGDLIIAGESDYSAMYAKVVINVVPLGGTTARSITFDPNYGGGLNREYVGRTSVYRNVVINPDNDDAHILGGAEINGTDQTLFSAYRASDIGQVFAPSTSGTTAVTDALPTPVVRLLTGNYLCIKNKTSAAGSGFDLQIYSTSSSGVSPITNRSYAPSAFGASSLTIFSMAIQPDGKVVLGGVKGVGANFRFTVIRLLADGTVDTSFGSNGSYTSTLGTNAQCRAIKVRSNGSIVAVGHEIAPATTGIVLQLTSSGALDNAFGTSGVARVSFQHSSTAQDVSEIYALGILPSGVLALGGSGHQSTNPSKPCYALLSSNGSTFLSQNSDIAFDGGVYALATSTEGNVYIAGQGIDNDVVNDTKDMFLYRIQGSGSIDPDFSFQGSGLFDYHGDDAIYDMAFQSDGNLVVVGVADSTAMFGRIMVSTAVVGIFDIETKEIQAYLYPNPVQDHFNLSFELTESSDMELNIIALDGSIVHQSSIQGLSAGANEQLIYLPEHLRQGMYIVQLRCGQSTKQIKIFKQ